MEKNEGSKKYPPKQYEDGKSPMQKRSMAHSCSLSSLSQVKESIGQDAWDQIKALKVGVIAKLVESNYVWSSKTVHYLLTRQLKIRRNEIWSVVGGRPIRFSLHEFAEITGLNTDPLPTEACEANHNDFWAELGVPAFEGPKFNELTKVLGICRSWDVDKRKMLGLLFILQVGIYGLHQNSRLPLEVAKRVFNDADMEKFPWGRVAFQSLMRGLNLVRYEARSFTVTGCVHVLLIWAYESIQVLGEKFGKKNGLEEVPLLRWGGTRTHASIETVISGEIKKNKKVRSG